MSDKQYAVYRVRDAAGTLLYAGCSLDPFGRLDDHRQTAPWFTRAASVTLEWHSTKAEALRAEARAILIENPECNRARPGGIYLPTPAPEEVKDKAERVRIQARLRQRRKRAKAGNMPPASRIGDAPVSSRIIELAETHGVHTRTIRRWIAKGKIAP